MRVRGQSPILWRCLGQSQVGAEPGHAVVVDGLSYQEQQLLDRLPTSMSPSDVYQVARWSEVPIARARELMSVLDEAGVLTRDVPTPSGDDETTSGELDNLPSVAHLIKLAQMLDDNKVSSTAGKEIFAEILQTDADPLAVAESKHLLQVSDEGAIEAIVDQVIAAPGCAKAVADFKSGQDKVIGFLVGQVMKQSKGQANPALAQKILRQKLK